MRFALVNVGSRGDVQPYLALGVGLQQAGHQVRFVTHANFESFVTNRGLEFAPLPGDPVKMIEDLMHMGTNWIRFLRIWLNFFAPIMDESLERAWEACQDCDALLVTPFTLTPCYHIAEKRDIPLIRLSIYPFDVTGAFPSIISPPELSLGTVYNRLTHQFGDYGVHVVFRSYFNRFRRKLGLPSMSLTSLPYLYQNGRPVPMLYAYSEQVIPRPQDWGDHIHITGYWFLTAEDNWQPSPALLDFLAAGPKPVYIGFGSMADEDFAPLSEIVLAAVKKSGQRAVLLTGWGGLGNGSRPDTVFKLDSAPHDWLFPRMAAVVHHGGAGTTSAGLRAGVPSVLVPFFGDQPFWGARVAQAGVGPQAIPRSNLAVDNLAAAIHTAATDEGIRQRAACLGEKIRAEDGVTNAIKIIETIVTG